MEDRLDSHLCKGDHPEDTGLVSYLSHRFSAFCKTTLFALLLAAATIIMSTPASAVIPPMTETHEGSQDLKPFPKWTGMVARFNQQDAAAAASCRNGDTAACNIVKWHQMLAGLKGRSKREQVDLVQAYFNKVPYIEDNVNWGKRDYWATPQEFLSRSGDCEDYAIAKYFSLRKLGFSEHSLRINIVQDMNLGGIMHSVLVVNLEGEELILDNQITQVRPVQKILHYKPVYAINEIAWWRTVR